MNSGAWFPPRCCEVPSTCHEASPFCTSPRCCPRLPRCALHMWTAPLATLFTSQPCTREVEPLDGALVLVTADPVAGGDPISQCAPARAGGGRCAGDARSLSASALAWSHVGEALASLPAGVPAGMPSWPWSCAAFSRFSILAGAGTSGCWALCLRDCLVLGLPLAGSAAVASAVTDLSRWASEIST